MSQMISSKVHNPSSASDSRLKAEGSKVYHYTGNGSLKNDGIAERLSGNRLADFN
jgi:hypothetical protein